MSFLTCICQRQMAKLMYRRGVTYEQQQSYQRAIEAFSTALDMGYPQPVAALVRRGFNRMELQNAEGAIADFESAMRFARNTNISRSLAIAQAYFYRGKVCQEMGDEAAAMKDWAMAIAYCPTYSYPYYHRALVYLKRNDRDNALSNLDAALEAYPTLALAYYQRGLLYHQSGDLICAINDLQCAVYNDFTLETAKQNLKHLQQAAYDAQLSRVLAAPLAEKNLTAKVHHRNDRLEIQVHRTAGVGINYYALPQLIRKHIAPLLLDGVKRFQLIGRVGKAAHPEWNQSYDLYQDRPCPPSHWVAALFAIVMFLPLAVPALIQAAWVKRAYKQGKYVESLRASRVAKGLSAASIIPFSFFMLLSVSYSSYDSDREMPVLRSTEQTKVAKQSYRDF
ncbi:CD225/dispanin family protein [cf. Phormidesmis sp. LEGE 11477]|uniref:CD225/dispanin family protein n=1 Tax=cf. Phormidesmis sp. LEGE 11477 TaxID=1828680 RepID=UPI00187E1062|nr:CD225/dispanin family protein [cf. Phormidesmis sp. LEGE 11477]MBE9062659.1 tetratricopeptide repeat protein [cf. Phormidesmis sp. LEGE 11477]